MKITIISPFFPYPQRGDFFGAERFTENLAFNLKKKGFDIKIVCSFWYGGKRYETYKGIHILRILDSKALLGNFGIKYCLHYFTFGLNLFRRKNFRFYKDSDIIILKPAIGFTRFFKLKKIPVVYVFFHAELSPSLYSLEKWLFKQHKNILAISNHSKNTIIRIYGIEEKNIKVIPIGIDLKRYNPSNYSKEIREKYGKNILLFSGLMLHRKRIPVLLKAMPRVIKEIPDVQLILTGKGRFLNQYKNLANSLGILKNVTFLGFVNDDELLKYYASSDIFVFPSVKEGFGQVILEAMASGTPVICTNKPPMSEIVGNGGKTFELNDSKDLSKKIIELLINRKKLNLLKENALKIAKNYNWLKIADNYIDYFKKIVKTKK